MARARLRRRSFAVLLLVAVGAAALPPAPGAAACPGVTVDGSWKRIASPVRALGFAIDSNGIIHVAGERTVMTSADGGCTWRISLDLDEAPTARVPAGERVVSIAIVGRTIVVALTGPGVLVSGDGGATWERGGEGLDVPGEPVALHPAPSGDVLYMIVRGSVSDGTLTNAGVPEQGVSVLATIIYRSADGGRSWTRGRELGASYTGPHGSDVEGGSAPGAAWDLAVDPDDADHLLAAARDGIFRSVDGGKEWTSVVFDPGAHVRAVTLWRDGAVAVDPSSGTLYETDDVTGVWLSREYPQLRTELMESFPNGAAWAWAAAGPGVSVSGPKGIFRLSGGALADVTPAALGGPGRAAADLQMVAGAAWARLLDGSALVTEVPGSASSGPQPAGAAGGGLTLGPRGTSGGIRAPRVDEGRVALTAGATRVALAPGESARVSYAARFDPRPVAVDLYFLVDTSASMVNTMRALVGGMQDIVTRLAASGIRLRAGLGAFRTYPRETDRLTQDYAYRRLRALGPIDGELVRALYELEGGGSSGANLTAIVQAVTGAGQDVLPPGPSRADVAAGNEAGFRDGALKVVMHLAETWFGTPERGDPSGYYAPGAWPGPSFEDTAAVLRSRGVKHLGVALQPGDGGTLFADADVVADMETLARATGSVAGERGADCDGDGTPDLRARRPLVCPLERGTGPGGLAAVVTGLVEALELRGDVRLVESGDSGLVHNVEPGVHRDVDLRAAQRLSFDVTVSCGLSDAGAARTVRLALVVAGDEAATTDLSVSCDELPAAAGALDPLRRRSGSPPLLPPIPVPPPPHPVPGPGPGSVTAPAPVQAPAPAQAPGGQPQGVAVAQRQQQPQAGFAVAVQRVRAQTQMNHAMVRTRARSPLEEARLWTAAGALSLLWVWGIAAAAVATARRARA